MKVLITGAGGFVGRNLSTALLQQGCEVTGMDVVADHIPDGVKAIAGDFCDTSLQEQALGDDCDAVVHLATVPGGAAEKDPIASRRVNVDAMHDLLDRVAALPGRPRFVYASSIAALGSPLPPEGVDDNTPLSPEMFYGGHKAMMELAVAMYSNRGAIDGVSLRLPGILARPKGPSGMKSAFMSNIFHALKAGETFVCPVSQDATIWALSVSCCVQNLVHALSCETMLLPRSRAVNLPARRLSMREMADEIAKQCDVSASLVEWQPDPDLQAVFGAHPPLSTAAAQRAGFAYDQSTATLVSNVLKSLS